MQPIQRKTGMQRTLVQQYVEVDIEKSEVGLWVDINKQSYSLNTQVTKCEMDLSELKWKGRGKTKRTAIQHVYIAISLQCIERVR